MLSYLEKLALSTEGRYATDSELAFIEHYLPTYELRLTTYQQIQQLEQRIIEEVYTEMQAIDPGLFRSNAEELSQKWRRDAIRTLRYVAVAVLIDDVETFRERFLFWFQTIMRAFGAQRSCNVTYEVMQVVVRRHLPSEQADLVCPILELTRQMLALPDKKLGFDPG